MSNSITSRPISSQAAIPRFCTIKDLATASGLSVGTVHRVLSGTGSASPNAVKRVLSALRHLNDVAVQDHKLGAFTFKRAREMRQPTSKRPPGPLRPFRSTEA